MPHARVYRDLLHIGLDGVVGSRVWGYAFAVWCSGLGLRRSKLYILGVKPVVQDVLHPLYVFSQSPKCFYAVRKDLASQKYGYCHLPPDMMFNILLVSCWLDSDQSTLEEKQGFALRAG